MSRAGTPWSPVGDRRRRARCCASGAPRAGTLGLGARAGRGGDALPWPGMAPVGFLGDRAGPGWWVR